MLPLVFDCTSNILPQLSAGIALYIHVPFCSSKCRYCDFYSQPLRSANADAFVDAVIAEWRLRSSLLNIEPSQIATCYLGGGTPSLLSASQIKRIVLGVFGAIPKNIEFTIECNPDSFSSVLAQQWLECGINRLSVGVQSLQPRELQLMGRRHTAAQARNLLADKILEQFNSVGVDIIYGLPAQSLDALAATLEDVFCARPIHHLSAYELTLSPQTPFGRHQRLLPLPPEKLTIAMHQLVVNRCAAYGLQRYEISNFALAGHHSEHNSSYWFRRPYLGLGPAAHSFWPPLRWNNAADFDSYCYSLAHAGLPSGFCESLALSQLGLEYSMVRLRTAEGVCPDEFRCVCGQAWLNENRFSAVKALCCKGLIVELDGRFKLTEKGLLRADAIAAALM
jgi:oxygen-independent coproporphyrinogen-3 oxidase